MKRFINILCRPLGMVTLLLISLPGCVSQKPVEWSAVGGSRADATVKLQYSYKYGTPNPDISQAIHLAKSRCASWGYASAELFGGENRVCNGSREPGLLGEEHCKGEWVVTKEFQCTGDGMAKKPESEPVAEPVVNEEQPAPVKAKKSKKKK